MSAQHADLLRGAAAWLCAEMMEAEVAARIGAAHGERWPDRLTNRKRLPPARVRHPGGRDELAIPKLRSGTYFRASWSRAPAASRRCRGRPGGLVKMDIEGAERDVLRQNTEWAALVRTILVEIHEPYDVSSCCTDLARLGFEVT